MADFLLYGSTGYVGRAAAQLAVDRGLRPILSGRSAVALEEQASDLGLDYRVASVDNKASLDEAMAQLPVVLNCAGPFIHTAAPILDACLRTGTHYLDITGEPPVYEMASSRDAAAKREGVMLLPSAGFDVVPTDCLAAYLKQRLPTASHLTLSFRVKGPAGLPPGTLNTMIEMIPYGSNKQHRVGGDVVAASTRKTRMIDFGEGEETASMMTWGDVILAHKSTGIPNIENYLVLAPAMVKQLDLTDRIRPMFRLPFVREMAKKQLTGGATEQEREETETAVWGEVTDDTGGRAVARLHGPEGGLVWTAAAAIGIVQRILGGDATPGFQTPSTAYGPDLVFDVEGVIREDVV
jgi:short subunit dehydrogenase-like uncharacterized protein